MKFGIGLAGGFEPSRLRRIAALAERLGFSHLWVADEGLHRNVYATLTLAALSTSTIGLGTAVTNPYTRHPALTAAAIATVDELSGGRVILGLGAGGSGPRVLGMERRRPVATVRDAVAIVNALTSGGRVEYQGDAVSFNGALDFAPVRRVPILVAARGPRMLRLAGEIADGVIIGGIATPEGIRCALEHVAAGARSVGRRLQDLQVVSWLYTSIAPLEQSRDAVRSIVAALIANNLDALLALGIPVSQEAVRTVRTARPDAASIASVCSALMDDVIDSFSLCGPPARCAARVRELSEVGVTQVAALIFPPAGATIEDQMTVIAAKVLTTGG